MRKLSKTNRNILCVFLALFVSVGTVAQERITGRVVDIDREPLMAVNVFVKNQTELGAVTNMSGQFELTVSTSDTLVFSYLGFERIEKPVTRLLSFIDMEIVLRENQLLINEFVVTSRASVSREFSIRELDPISIYMSPISAGDPLRAIAMLPYSTNTSESANPDLRGSSGDYSRVIINNVPVYNPVRNTQLNGMGNFSLLNTDLIDKQLVYAGNPPLKYGNSIAGLVEVQTVNELKESGRLKLALSLANVGFMYANNISRNSFFQVYGNHQFSSAYLSLNKSNIEHIKDFSNNDVGLNFRINMSEYLSVNLYSYMIREKYNSDYGRYNYFGSMQAASDRNFNIVNIDFRKNNLLLSVNNGTNFLRSDFLFGDFDARQNERQIYTSFDAKYHFVYTTLQAGVAHDYATVQYHNTGPIDLSSVSLTDTHTSHIHNHNIEAYLYGKITLDRFIVGAGLRKNIPVGAQTQYLSCQANIRYNINSTHSIILSGGKYHGYSIPRYPVFSYYPVSSSQFAFDYMFRPGNRLSANFSLYSKKELVPVYFQKYGVHANSPIQIKGAEISAEYSMKRVNLTGSFVWLDSKINTDEGWIKSGNTMNYFIRKSVSYINSRLFNVSISGTFRPGHLYTPIIGAEYNAETHNYKPVYAALHSAQYSSYSSIDLTFNRIIRYKTHSITAFLTLNNLFNKANQQSVVYTYDYSSKNFWLYQRRLLYFGVTVTL
jgi:hypothetical protein